MVKRAPAFFFLRILLMTIILLIGAVPSPGQVGPVADSEAVLVSLMHATIEQGAEAAALRLHLASETLSVDAETLGDGPTLGWQSEGLDTSFGREANAVDYLRFGKSFNDPRQRAAGREWRLRQADWVTTAERAGLLEIAAASGRLWLEWAAAEARLELAETRLERLERILILQRKKLELGEVAGAEVEQLLLEQARDQVLVSRMQARIRALATELEARVGKPVPPPDAEALAALTAKLGPLSRAQPVALSDLESPTGVRFDEAKASAETARARARLNRALAWGRPEFEVEWERVPTIDGVDGFDAIGFQLAVPLPFGRRGRALRAQATIDAERAEKVRDQTRRAIGSRLTAARAEALTAEENLTALGEFIERMPATEYSLREQFRLGAISYLVLIDGLSRLDEVRGEVIEARRTMLVARLELAALSGDRAFFPLPELEVQP